MNKAPPSYLRSCLATLGSELGLQGMCCKLLTYHPSCLSLISFSSWSPFPLISQVCSLPAPNLPNPQLGKRAKATFADVPLTLPSDPQIFGTLIDRLLNKPSHLISQFFLFLSFWVFFAIMSLTYLIGALLFYLSPLNESQGMGEEGELHL